VRLRDVLAEVLEREGIERVYTPIRMEGRNPIQQIAVEIANGRASLCKAQKNTSFSYDLSGRILGIPADAFAGNCSKNVIVDREKLIKAAKEKGFPYVVVDLSFLNLHSDKEKSRLKVQLKATLGVIRDFMWDERLVIAGSADFPLSEFSPKVLYFKNAADFLKDKTTILLDPNAEEVFKGERAECYVIGGIVDKAGNKKGLTGKIGEKLEKEGVTFRSMRIELRGDVVGVPDRINAIAEIVLLSVLDGLGIEEAIKRVQSPLVARWRLKKELPKISKRFDSRRPFRFVKKSDFGKFGWLNLSYKDFLEVSRRLGFLVLSDELAARLEELR
jgi:tRNA (adenine9-N1/guanine9-N1)-methyltransferase